MDDMDTFIETQDIGSDLESATHSTFGKARDGQRSRVGPMDIDTADSSWLETPSDQHTRKRRLVGAQREESPHRPVLGNTPFVFSMPPPPLPEPMDWQVTKTATRSDNRPISPHAARKIATRRRQDNDSDTFAHIQNSPMVSDQRFSRRRQRRQHQQQQQVKSRRQQQRRRAADDSSAWTTASSESEGESDDSRATTQSRRQQSNQSRGQQQSQNRGRRSARSRRQWRMSHGVDRMLALMGSRVEEPTLTERLQMHRDIPYVISGYLQLGLNVLMVGAVLMLLAQVLMTIQRDVTAKVHEYSAEILHEIATCGKQYRDNRCDPLMRVPAMEQACQAWENCMHRDPTKVGRAKVSAETLAEIVNGFIEPISLKTMLFFVTLFFGTLFISNFAFGAYRHSRVHQQYVNQSGSRNEPASAVAERLASALRMRRNDDPLASPSPHAATAQMLVPSSARQRRNRRAYSPSPSHTRR
ncbi:hypothetical protein H4S02_001198 [Coemansia sp. RSA 2611]|nr:hypothetical protein H4S02_001198 [Coemansia sp. RSA 2611]